MKGERKWKRKFEKKLSGILVVTSWGKGKERKMVFRVEEGKVSIEIWSRIGKRR